MPGKPSHGRKKRRRFPWLSCGGVLLVVAVIFLHTGLPAPCLDLISRGLGTDRHAVTLASAYAPSPGAFRLVDVRVARRGRAVPAWLRIGAATGSWRPRRGLNLHLENLVLDLSGLGEEPLFAPWGNPRNWPETRFRLEIDKLRLLGLELRRVAADVAFAEGRIRLENLRIESASSAPESPPLTGALSLDLETGETSARLGGNFLPNEFIPVLEAIEASGLARFLDRFEFSRPAHCDPFEFAYNPRRNLRRLRMLLRAENLRYRGVSLDAASAGVEAEGDPAWERFRIRNFTAEKDGDRISADLEYDPREDMMTVRAVSTLPLPPLARMLDLPPPPEALRVRPPPMVTITGRVAMSASAASRTRLQGSGAAEAAEFGRFALENIAMQYRIDETAYDISSLQAGMAEGTLDGRVVWWRDRGGSITGRQARLLLSDAAVGKMARAVIRRPLDLEGVMDLGASISLPHGTGDPLESMSGRGEINIHDSHLFRLPLFSGLTDLLADHVPGIESLVSQTEAFCTFDLEPGRFRTDDAMIEGDVFSLRASGEYRFTNRLDFVIQLRFLRSRSLGGKVMRVVGYPLSKLFEMRLEGPLEAPRWRILRILEYILPNSKAP